MEKFSDTFLEDSFAYLDGLRESGVTNMFGASPYLIEEFALTKAEARQVLKYWMETFNDDSVTERVAKVSQS